VRKISSAQIVVFLALLLTALALSAGTTWILLGRVPLGDFRGVVLTLSAIMLLYLYAILDYRLFLRFFPLRTGEIEPASGQEFIYHVYILHYLMLFYPLLQSRLLPVPLLRVGYQWLGAKLGTNTWGSGTILDPPFVQIGDDCVIGMDSILCPHVIEGNRLAHYPIRIGNKVTIGAGATILSNVEIGDGAIIGMRSLVAKGARVGAGELWTGIPARCQRLVSDSPKRPPDTSEP
jgi:serine acetyltransferase